MYFVCQGEFLVYIDNNCQPGNIFYPELKGQSPGDFPIHNEVESVAVVITVMEIVTLTHL